MSAEVIVELLGDTLDIERLAEALGHLDYRHVASGIELADIEDQGAEFAQEEIAGLVDFKIVIAGVRFAGVPLPPIPQAFVSPTVDEDQEILLVRPRDLLVHGGARLGRRNGSLGGCDFEYGEGPELRRVAGGGSLSAGAG